MEEKTEKTKEQIPVTFDEVLAWVREWVCFANYPRSEAGEATLARAFQRITGDRKRADWLQARVIDGCTRCPMPIEMRRILEERYPAADGIAARDLDVSECMDKRRQ